MAYAQSPPSARARYAASFNSSIFAPAEQQTGPAFVPAGKRRDQSTSEMFGTYAEKDLRSCPKTFIPSEDYTNARQKKQNFLNSDVLPRSQYPPNMEPREAYHPDRIDSDEEIDPNWRRQNELSSQLFDRKTPNCTAEQANDRSTRLTPNDFSWHNHPQRNQDASRADMESHAARAYKEKCSSVFGHKSPPSPSGARATADADRQAREDESITESKRRANCNYSDLFGRETPMDAPERTEHGTFRPKHQGSHEEQMIIHADWTDSKTELMSGARAVKRPEHPMLRKSDELHQTRIFGRDSGGYGGSVDRPESMTYDNSHKVKGSIGQHTQNIHQAHLRTSMQAPEFYAEAESTKHWEVVELHISGLGRDADNDRLKQLCQNCDVQIVRAAVDMDPVRNMCKGRGKVMVRYNPHRDSISGLMRRLEESQLRVEV